MMNGPFVELSMATSAGKGNNTSCGLNYDITSNITTLMIVNFLNLSYEFYDFQILREIFRGSYIQNQISLIRVLASIF